MAEKKKIFVVSGFHFHPDEHEHDIITEVFNTREKAAKCIFDILTETFPDDAEDFSIDGCMYGNNFCTADDVSACILGFLFLRALGDNENSLGSSCAMR